MSANRPPNLPPRRISMKEIWNDILKALNLEKGLGYTIWYLNIRPGQEIKRFLYQDRKKLMKPLPFLLLMVAIGAYLTVNYLDFGEIFNNQIGSTTDGKPALDNPFNDFAFTNQYYNLAQFVSVPFFAFSSFLLFKSYRLNYAEHLVTSAYLTGILNIWYSVTIPFVMLGIGYYLLSTLVIMLLFWLYSAYTYKDLFEIDWKTSLLRSLGVQVLYYTFFGFVMILMGLVIAAIMLLTRS